MMQTKLAFDPEELRREIAEVIANEVKSYSVPSICVHFSIQKTVDEADSHEAHSSKRSYVKARLSAFSPSQLLTIAAEPINGVVQHFKAHSENCPQPYGHFVVQQPGNGCTGGRH